MGKIVVTEFVSLDGVMEDPGGSEHSKHGAWTFKFSRGEEGDKFKFDATELQDPVTVKILDVSFFEALFGFGSRPPQGRPVPPRGITR